LNQGWALAAAIEKKVTSKTINLPVQGGIWRSLRGIAEKVFLRLIG
jgi:hypothetical protein